MLEARSNLIFRLGQQPTVKIPEQATLENQVRKPGPLLKTFSAPTQETATPMPVFVNVNFIHGDPQPAPQQRLTTGTHLKNAVDGLEWELDRLRRNYIDAKLSSRSIVKNLFAKVLSRIKKTPDQTLKDARNRYLQAKYRYAMAKTRFDKRGFPIYPETDVAETRHSRIGFIDGLVANLAKIDEDTSRMELTTLSKDKGHARWAAFNSYPWLRIITGTFGASVIGATILSPDYTPTAWVMAAGISSMTLAVEGLIQQTQEFIKTKFKKTTGDNVTAINSAIAKFHEQHANTLDNVTPQADSQEENLAERGLAMFREKYRTKKLTDKALERPDFLEALWEGLEEHDRLDLTKDRELIETRRRGSLRLGLATLLAVGAVTLTSLGPVREFTQRLPDLMSQTSTPEQLAQDPLRLFSTPKIHYQEKSVSPEKRSPLPIPPKTYRIAAYQYTNPDWYYKMLAELGAADFSKIDSRGPVNPEHISSVDGRIRYLLGRHYKVFSTEADIYNPDRVTELEQKMANDPLALKKLSEGIRWYHENNEPDKFVSSNKLLLHHRNKQGDLNSFQEWEDPSEFFSSIS